MLLSVSSRNQFKDTKLSIKYLYTQNFVILLWCRVVNQKSVKTTALGTTLTWGERNVNIEIKYKVISVIVGIHWASYSIILSFTYIRLKIFEAKDKLM